MTEGKERDEREGPPHSLEDAEAGPGQVPPESPTPGEIGVETGDVDPHGQPLPTAPAISGEEIQRKAHEADPAEKGPDDDEDDEEAEKDV